MIFATTNQGKIKEIKEILGNINEDIVSLKEAGIDVDIVETERLLKRMQSLKQRRLWK